jgi:hypothetical protein
MFVDVDQVDVAGDIELARAELAHADDPELDFLAGGSQRRAVAAVEFGAPGCRHVQGQLGQLGDGLGHHGERCLLLAVQHDDALHHQLAQHAQRRGEVQAARLQRAQGLLHQGGRGLRRQGVKPVLVTAVKALHKARVLGREGTLRAFSAIACSGDCMRTVKNGVRQAGNQPGNVWLPKRARGAGHNSCHC